MSNMENRYKKSKHAKENPQAVNLSKDDITVQFTPNMKMLVTSFASRAMNFFNSINKNKHTPEKKYGN